MIILGPPAGMPTSSGETPFLSDKELEDSSLFVDAYRLCTANLRPDAEEAAALRRFDASTEQHLYYYVRRGQPCYGAEPSGTAP
ncbi:hypothetical protein [Terriglobus sp.]|uniref:hypothetical protein n=1 Tax=Terriglobus sp. TaxID=1889013 RepID=UPI003B00E631